MSHNIKRADEFILENKGSVVSQYKPQFHFSPPVGWLNDPNGLVYFRGEYHLFYQFHPYDSIWGPMHWGHAKSKDLLHWEELPVALAPDQDYDKDGCFSGSAIVKNDTLWLMYTGHIVDSDGEIHQVQNMAYSTDGIAFTKLASNPVATGDILPKELIASDFRDPKLFRKEGVYYAVVAAKHQDGVGTIVLLESDNLEEWTFTSIFLKGEPHQGIMWECPDYFELDGVSCLVISPMRYQKNGVEYANVNSSILMTGVLDWQQKTFHPNKVQEIDRGHDFYAPQTFENELGERTMIAWMQTWGRTNVTHELDHGWSGTMTIPRVIRLNNGIFTQTIPEKCLEQLPVLSTNTLVDVGYFQDDWSDGSIFRLGNEEDYVEFGYDLIKKELYIDRNHLKLAIQGEEEWEIGRRSVHIDNPSVLVVLDKNSIELFVNDGQITLTSTYFLSTKRYLQQIS